MHLSDIFPVRSIYLGSGFAVLVWGLPYVFGLVVHYLRIGRWAKGISWLLLVLFIPSFMLARVFAWGLENDLYTPRTILMSVSCVVVTGQAVFWGLLWMEHRRRGEPAAWRTIAHAAFIASLVLSFLSFGGFFVEKRYRYLETVRLRQQTETDLKHLDKVGYAPYPDAVYEFGDCMIRAEYENETLAGYTQDMPGGYNGFLSIDFRTTDDPLRVIHFYSDHAWTAGLTVRRGVSRATGAPVMVGFGARDDAIVVEQLPPGREPSNGNWAVTVYWKIPKGFQESLDLGFRLEGI
jgi:hypothetical protein